MNDKDRFVMYAGVFIAVIVLIGSATLEGEEPPAGEGGLFNVLVNEEEATIREQDYCGDGDTVDYEFDIDQINLLEIEFRLTWNDDTQGITDGANDDFTLEVSWENGTAESDSSGSGSISIDFDDLNEKPKSEEAVSGESEEAVAKSYEKDGGMGRYSVTVRCDDAGDSQPILNDDTGNDFTLDVIMTYFKVSVTEPPDVA